MPKCISIVSVEKRDNKYFTRRSTLRAGKPTTEYISSRIDQRNHPLRIITSLTR
jgi:hypothetical protein